MRIAVWYNLPSGGAKRALHDHVRGLAGRGHELEFFAPAGHGREYLPLGEYGKEHTFAPVGANADVRLWRWARKEPATRRKQLAAVGRHSREAAAAIDAGRFDVLFANTCWITAAPPVARHASTPAVLYLQEPNRPLYEAGQEQPAFASLRPAGRSWLAPWYIRHWVKDRLETPIRRRQVREEWESAKAYRRILVNSSFSRESILRAYGLEAEVCYLGVDASAFSRPLQPGPRDYLIGVGSIAPPKNIGFVLRAVGCLPTPRPRLVWVANAITPSHLSDLQALAKQQGVDFEVRKLIPQQELTALLGGALAMLYAPRLEPFGYAPLEANACGTLVVAVAEGGVRETVQDGVNGLVVPPRPEAMAAAIGRLQADPALASRLGEGGRRLVETEWSLDAATDRLEAALVEVAGGRVGAAGR